MNKHVNLVRFLNISANILNFYALVDSKTYKNLNATVRKMKAKLHTGIHLDFE